MRALPVRSLSSHNLVHLVASCQAVGLASPELAYGLLRHLLHRFTEHDVQLIVSPSPPASSRPSPPRPWTCASP